MIRQGILCPCRPRLAAWLCAALCVLPAQARPPLPIDPVTGVVALAPAQLAPRYWLARQPAPDRLILDAASIATQNARMRALDPHIHDLHALPSPLPAAWVRGEIDRLSARPILPLYDADGHALDATALDALAGNLNLAAIPAQRLLQYGLVTHRAALRTFPTAQRVFSRVGDNDIDRFQESALFPGDAVAVLHESADGQWLFVASERYLAWIQTRYVAVGSAAQVFGYGQHSPYRVVTGATAFTAFTPEQPRLSRLQLDMGVRLPVLADWPATQPVNGQLPYTAWVVQLPLRNADGSLGFAPALLPRTADTAPNYLPLTPRNLIAQAFKFLGERYGWGHDYDSRDCSGFVAEIYRSFGVLLPRNTGAQATSPALDRIAFARTDSHARRMAAVSQLQVGDLVYIPGHVMVALGHDRGLAYVIHDTAGGSWAGPDGKRIDGHLNGVSVTPLEPMLASDQASYVDLITNIQRMRPREHE
jgi:cell wall-associated NlpC family hydrolase